MYQQYTAKDFQPVFDLVKGMVGPERLPSAVLGITQKDRIICMEAFGSWPDGKKVSEDDIYLIFSVTKPVVGLAIMQLWEQGRLHPNEPVQKYLPGFGAKGKDKMTIWHLLTHTSGIEQRQIAGMGSEEPLSYEEIHKEFYEAILDSKLDFPCGAYKNYNNTAISILGEIVKAVSGLELDAYLEKNIFAPLGMKDTSFSKHREARERVIPIVGNEDFSRAQESFYNAKVPAGGLFSTASDLLVLCRALLNQGTLNGYRVIHPYTLKAMITPQTAGIPPFKPGDFEGEEVGLTWRLPVQKRSVIYKNMYGHNGMGRGKMWLYPEDGAAFVLMANYIGPGFKDMDLDAIYNVFSSCLRTE